MLGCLWSKSKHRYFQVLGKGKSNLSIPEIFFSFFNCLWEFSSLLWNNCKNNLKRSHLLGMLMWRKFTDLQTVLAWYLDNIICSWTDRTLILDKVKCFFMKQQNFRHENIDYLRIYLIPLWELGGKKWSDEMQFSFAWWSSQNWWFRFTFTHQKWKKKLCYIFSSLVSSV